MSHLISEMIRWCNFYCRGQVEDDTVIEIRTSSTPRLLDSFTNFERKVGLGLAERLRTILEPELGAVLFCTLIGEFANDLSVFDG